MCLSRIDSELVNKRPRGHTPVSAYAALLSIVHTASLAYLRLILQLNRTTILDVPTDTSDLVEHEEDDPLVSRLDDELAAPRLTVRFLWGCEWFGSTT